MRENLNGIVTPLLDWYDMNKRTLPWRGTRDPYKVLVSEIMLQQTRVAAVIPYYQRWMEELPNVETLADADEERLMKLWQGLGYYSRARNLQKAAKMIMETFNGQFPEEYTEILKLPGVGEYTAGAVASIAFGQAVPAVDGNVLRVAARVMGDDGNIMDLGIRRQFREVMEDIMPTGQPGEFNQALMDLGATVCLPNGAPLCGSCPLTDLCEANRLGIQDTLPVRKKKAARRQEDMTVYLLIRNGCVAVRRRANAGLLAGLWEFPHVTGNLTEEEAPMPLREWGLVAANWQKHLAAKHIFTHVEWRMTGYLLQVSGECPDFAWVDLRELNALAIPSAFRKFLQEAQHALRGEEDA